MKLLLRQDFESLGVAGDVVNVKPGFARNFLILVSMIKSAPASEIPCATNSGSAGVTTPRAPRDMW